MTQHKEFHGKSLDEAIREACEYYGVARGKLEIEILSDAKTGIFGLVGAKKASIRARKVTLNALEDETAAHEPEAAPAKRARTGHARGRQEGAAAKETNRPDGRSAPTPRQGDDDAGQRRPQDRKAAAHPAQKNAQDALSGSAAEPSRNARSDEKPAEHTTDTQKTHAPAGQRKEQANAPRSGNLRNNRRPNAPTGIRGGGRPAPAAPAAGSSETDGESLSAVPAALSTELLSPAGALADEEHDAALPGREEMPPLDLHSCDRDRLFAVVEEVTLRLVSPIIGAVPCTLSIVGNRVRAELDCGDAAGLLVGRDGQTLASVQYLASRIVSRIMQASVLIQFDAGKYRERQEDKLKELALALAEKVRSTGRPQSTRPLSAYQRRIVHLALEDDEEIVTRSSGDGAQRRVVICRNRKGARPPHNNQDADCPAPPAAQDESTAPVAPVATVATVATDEPGATVAEQAPGDASAAAGAHGADV